MGKFKSRLAPYMEGLIEQKRANGYSYHSGELLLLRLDAFCYEKFPNEATVTYDLAAGWLKHDQVKVKHIITTEYLH